MAKLRLFFRSVGYSVRLSRRSGGVLIWLYPAAALMQTALTLFGTFALKYILDYLTEEDIRRGMVILWAGLYLLSLVLCHGCRSAKDILYGYIFEKAEHLYECDLLEKLDRLPLSFIDSSEGKDMAEDVRYTKNTAVYTAFRILEIISLFYTFVIAYATTIRFNVWFSLMFLILTIPGIILGFIFDEKAEKLRLRKAPDVRRFSYYRWMLTDAWPAKDVRTYDLTEPVKARYLEEKDRYIAANKKLDKKKTWMLLPAEALRRSGEIVYIVFVVYAALKKRIGMGDVALYTGFALTAGDAFERMVSVLTIGYRRATDSMGRLFEFLDMETEEKKECRELRDFESLEFENVYFKYPNADTYVLSGVSFTINKNDRVFLVGVNGAGKSTIVKLMMGLYPVGSGRILINGYPMTDYDIWDVRHLFSILFQDFVQYPLTLRENVAMSALKDMKNDGDIEEALVRADVFKDIEGRIQNGLNSEMTRMFDDRGLELSKGQWQKIALARVYFKKASIIVFDEPSASLDAEAEDRVFQNFASVSGGKTAVMISHRISAARMANKIIVLDGGKVVGEGTHDSLTGSCGLYAKMYSLQREKYADREEIG